MIRTIYSDRIPSKRGPSPNAVRNYAKQSFKDQCDLSRVIKSHISQGIPLPVAPQPQYGDYSKLGEYQESINITLEARAQFDALPDHIRRRFKNDPSYLLNFVSDDKNYDEAVKLGLVNPKEPVEQPAPTTNTSTDTTPTV